MTNEQITAAATNAAGSVAKYVSMVGCEIRRHRDAYHAARHARANFGAVVLVRNAAGRWQSI